RPAHLTRLVLEIELDCVDLLRADEVHDSLAERVVRPGVGGHMDGADRGRGAAWNDGHRDAPAAPVAGGVDGSESEAARRCLEAQLEGAVAGDRHALRAGEQSRAG